MVKSVFHLTTLENPELQKYKDKALKDLNKFFGQKWIYKTPKIYVVDDRKTIDLLKEQETEAWVVGWSWGTMAIYILNPKNISKESCHDGSTYNIEHLIKHELCHSFFQMTFGTSKFGWINEGVAVYVAGQLDKYSMPRKFNGFLDGKNLYQESGNAIKLIMENFGKDTLFEFLKKQSGIEKKAELSKIFKEVFRAKLDYQFFNELKDKTSS